MKQLVLLFIMLSMNICEAQTTFKDSLDLSKKIKKIGIELYNDGKHFSAVGKFKHSLTLLPKNTQEQKIILLFSIGNSFNRGKVIDSSKYYLNKVDKLCNDSVSNTLKSIKYKSRAYIQMNNKIPDKAMISLLKALDYAKLSDNKKLIAGIYSDIGVLFLNDQNLLKAEGYFNKSIDLALKSNDSLRMAYSLNYLGVAAFSKKNYKISEIKHREALKIFKKLSCDMGVFLAKVSMSKALYFQGSIEESMKLTFEALPLLNEMEFGGQMKKAIDNTKELKKMHHQLGTVDSITDKDSIIIRTKTIKLFNENMEIFRKEDVDANIDVDLGLVKYKEKDRVIFFSEKELSEKLKQTIIRRDSIFQKSLDSKYAELETKYKTQEKEKKNLQLQNEATERELVLEKENKQKWLFGIGLLTAIITLGIFTFFYRRNKKQKQFIEYLQKEMHHRIKNNLSIINAFIDNASDTDNEDIIQNKLLDLQNRIDSIYHIHEQLHISKHVTTFNVKSYVNTLCKNVQESFFMEDIEIINTIEPKLDIDPDKSFSIGLIINEFLTNSFKHAFKDTNDGKITIDIKEDKEFYFLSLIDNGKGLPADIDINKLKSYGLKIITLLAKQLKGTFLLENNKGVSLMVKFPKS